MRIVKEAEERKEEILDAAEKLFGTKGFDHTSTNDILEAVGIARGTLYYHFKSKEEILDGVIERISNRLMLDAGKVIRDTELPVLERLTKAILALNVESEIGHEVMEQVHRPQNALMHQKMQQQLLDGITPLFTELVEEGVRQGICHTDYPGEVVEMTLIYANTAFDELNMEGLSQEKREQKIDGFIYNMERLMGMEEGSLQDTIRKVF
ncbi:TetR/AcrR family transcriptional regulator [Lachnospiraceae bacterium HCP28S3_F9]|nr:TetR/AcrR family transcriptional regulator [Lachnospiraceae bacterium]MCI6534274.1 TetR/AcrR family transcriptional regulator [Lachnospiraceae bacterium]MDY2612747.1 TetR/AcrR family transcriptional regulator [Lachnospiraceae bacterium]